MLRLVAFWRCSRTDAKPIDHRYPDALLFVNPSAVQAIRGSRAGGTIIDFGGDAENYEIVDALVQSVRERLEEGGEA